MSSLTPESYTLYDEMAVLIATTGVPASDALFSLNREPTVSSDGQMVEALYLGDLKHFVDDPGSVEVGRPTIHFEVFTNEVVSPYLVVANEADAPKVYAVDLSDVESEDDLDNFRSYDAETCSAAIRAASAVVASLRDVSLEATH